MWGYIFKEAQINNDRSLSLKVVVWDFTLDEEENWFETGFCKDDLDTLKGYLSRAMVGSNKEAIETAKKFLANYEGGLK